MALELKKLACIGMSHDFNQTFLGLVSNVGSDSLILDVGGGDRRLNLPSYVNIDIIRHPSMTTVVSDAHFLPFRENCFSIVLSEAAIEHFRKPWIVTDEFFRVLKKDGFVYVDAAFMQPVHGRPNHYFNMTINGVESLFEKFKKIDSGVQPYQMPSYTIIFILSNYLRCLFPFFDKRSENAKIFESGIFMKNQKGSVLFVNIYKMLHYILSILDRQIPSEKAARISAGVFFLGQKT